VRDFQAISVLGCGAITLGVAWLLVAGIIPGPISQPNERSLHKSPVPRIGGIAIWAGWFAAWPGAIVSWAWLAPIVCVIAVSLIDDWRGLPAYLRLSVHAGAGLAAAAPYHDLTAALGWALVAFDALVIAWMANLYNFMDGADGLAGVMGTIGFAAYSFAAMLAGQSELATLCAALAVACAAFLAFNRPPARLFMGDVGAVGLGFVAGVVGLHGYSGEVWGWWFPPLVFAPFIVDSSVTLARRWRRGDSLARPHREHFYQRAILIDGSHSRTLFVYAGWMAACAALALACLRQGAAAGGVALVLASAAFGWYCRRVDRRWASHIDPHHAG
jgi:UDP-N-acetylmuramyl pentapeptide phosphotransferase/UDP-N-acetylglucosamine-1-phosphate transferase